MNWLRLILLLLAALLNPQYVFIQTELDRQWRLQISRQIT